MVSVRLSREILGVASVTEACGQSGYIAVMQLDMTTGKINPWRATVSRTRVGRDLVADWKRWTLAERVIAAAIIPAVVLVILVMSTALASGIH